MKALENIENINWEMLAKYLSNEASAEEKQEIEAWFGQSGENISELKHNQKLLEKVDMYYQTQKYDVKSAWSRLESKINTEQKTVAIERQPQRRLINSPFMRIAASLILALTLGFGGYYLGFRQKQPAIYTEVITHSKQILQEVLLPDGTRVTINSNSKLTYPQKFSGNLREVSIEGEAFFEVKPDAAKPFVISAGNARIRVLGTSFNVSAYPGSETVEVVVETGKVQVISNPLAQQPDGEVFLMRGEKGVVNNLSYKVLKSVNQNPNVMAWKTNEFVFNQTPMLDVIQNLEKVYHVEIQVSDSAINDLVLTAHFQNQTIDFIMEVVRLTFNMELSAQNGQYFLTSRDKNFKN